MLPIRFAVACSMLAWFVPAQTTAVLVARSADGAQRVFLSAEHGLRIVGRPAAPDGILTLGPGSRPRFDASGRLWFVRTVDDGTEILSTELWVLDAGATQPRPAPPDAAFPRYALPPTTAAATSATKVCLDPGHGGSDPGAIGIGGLQEKFVNLDVVLRLINWLNLDTQDTRGGGSWTLLATRTTDIDVDLSARANMANAFGAASFVSVHMNSFTSSAANGTETYCMTGTSTTTAGVLRNTTHSEARAAWGLTDRGVKEANFAVLRLTAMPATLLEGGFITSPVDVLKLQDANERDRLALHIMYALQQFHGFGRYLPSSTTPTGTLKGVLYDAAQGTSVRIGSGIVALADGTFTAVRSSDGYFQFTLPAGTYSYAATGAGFDAAELSRTVPAGGEVWGSLGLMPANVPSLTMNPAPSVGQSLGIVVQGDVGAPVVLVLALTPGLPLLDLNFLGLGVVWPNINASLSVGLGSIPAGGSLSSNLPAPGPSGLLAHGQAVTRAGGAFRLSNGAAFQVQ